ncbi:uncharacterized protein K02A2.6-like [Macrosteles quadrilineatus]|uniref:uncharacterized protein K02A2.6-like n=1 Tax=Macrosteles quadrilineatus TaxID=74068 RepID=UPI0023E25D4F|nr:uncharacterized protein K02A2.6-like [Macrosteles quadrilineatus]
MRLLVFDYKTTYLPGKENFTADCLSRSPGNIKEDFVKDRIYELTVDDALFIRSIVETFPCSDKRLEEIKQAQGNDPESREILSSILENNWRKNSIFWKFRDELVLEDGLIVKGRRMFIPRSLRKEILSKIHEGHLGIVKCRSRAKESVWWPGCSRDVKSEVENCLVCLEHRQVNKEPLMPTELPKGPWVYLSADLFICNRKWFLVVQDYYSRFIELVELSVLSSNLVVGKLKNIFARHGNPYKIRTDGGTQFTSQEFKDFAKEYGFEATTTSPYFPQANGGAENAVSIAKRILLKNKDQNLGLLVSAQRS